MEGLLVLGIASLDVEVVQCVDEILLFLTHFPIESTSLCQPFVVVNVRRIVGLSATPVSLQYFFNNLMAHKSHVQPPFGFVHCLGSFQIVVC